MWARKNGWLVILEPNPGRYSREIADIKRSNNGVYIQSEFAQQFLEAMSLANRHLLQEIPVDYESYGSRGIDGEAKQVGKSWNALRLTVWQFDKIYHVRICYYHFTIMMHWHITGLTKS